MMKKTTITNDFHCEICNSFVRSSFDEDRRVAAKLAERRRMSKNTANLRQSVQICVPIYLHLIPRRNGDTQNPRGEVRGVIPEKMSY